MIQADIGLAGKRGWVWGSLNEFWQMNSVFIVIDQRFSISKLKSLLYSILFL